VTSIQYRAAIKLLGLSQVKAGKFLGVNERTSRRWALGEYDVPEWAIDQLNAAIEKLEHHNANTR
jgi:hypothetical protein